MFDQVVFSENYMEANLEIHKDNNEKYYTIIYEYDENNIPESIYNSEDHDVFFDDVADAVMNAREYVDKFYL